MSSLTPTDGPALFNHGSRPFFLAAIVFAAAVIPVWLLVWRNEATLGGPFDPVDWHVHEMLFGYTGAVIAESCSLPFRTGSDARPGANLC